ncbi:DUF4870 domain-containing protein [Deinococcus roseus]|uniref:DUF4870 domain-containing protein n=1 Tax=Deinococcus roseus TaxID=392414 RepID=A0ABQ2CY37_9DEIO|nr:DUF4870 domain-containing protein [Deinococcus roseus]GGJ32127.1 hypothetical protein GCM10008938_17940 [Deinococcus roseus]
MSDFLKPSNLDAPQGVFSKEEQTYAIIQHLSALAGLLIPTSFGNVIGALVAWLVFRDRSSNLNEQGKEVLNYQISVTLYLWAAGIIATVLGFVTFGLGFLLTVPAMGILWVLSLIPSFIGVSEASKGNFYRYPYTIRLL